MLRHRILRTFHAEAENISVEHIITKLIEQVPREQTDEAIKIGAS